MTRCTAIGLAALLACCATKRTAVVPSPPDDPLAGRSSVRILNSPEVGRVREESRVTVVSAEAGPENALPVYPPAALQARCGSGVVPTRIHIGTNGRVVRQSEGPGRNLARDSCHGLFAEAVRSAVSRWGFFPAMRRVCEGDGATCTDTPITIFLDLEYGRVVIELRSR